MILIDRYLVSAVLGGVLVVLIVLVAIGTLVDFVGQLDDVGTAEYGLSTALSYVGLRVPRLIFEMLPAAALLGALLGLGNLAVHRELIVMRASGVSHSRMLGAVGIAGLVLVGVMVLLGESLAPTLGAYARELRTQALHEGVDLADGQSAWLKIGDRIVNLRQQADEIGFGGVLLFEIGPEGDLRQVARADSAGIDNDRWVLANYAETLFGPDGIDASAERLSYQDYGLSLDLLGLSVVREDLLDTPGLQRYIVYLEENGLDARPYLIAYWARMADTASVLLMTVLALPFVFGGLRSAGTGGRLLVGLLIGLTYYVVAEVLANSGEVFDIDPRIVAWAPSGVLLLVAAVSFARMR